MKPLVKNDINEIAEHFNCGFKCFLNIKTSKMIFFPDEDAEFVDIEFWKKEKLELKRDKDNFIEIPKPSHLDCFNIMEEFIETIGHNEKLKKELESILKLKKTFTDFKQIIDYSDEKESWLVFKQNW